MLRKIRPVLLVAGLAAFLVAWNNVVNLLPGFQRWYVAVNLVLTAALALVARSAGLSRADLGLDAAHVAGGLRWGGAATTVVALVLGAALAHPRGQRLLRDERQAGQSGAALARTALLRIPLGTVALEEFAFRGLLLGAWAQDQSTAAAVIGSSAVFGLWHVVPTLALVDANRPAAGFRRRLLAAGGGVAFTAAAGVVLCMVRLAGGGLLAPAMAHTATNSLGAAASWVALRHAGTAASGYKGPDGR